MEKGSEWKALLNPTSSSSWGPLWSISQQTLWAGFGDRAGLGTLGHPHTEDTSSKAL